ncbi:MULTISPECIES: 4'-phosphopantetheinyl transferase family protein [unclassified Lacinutrix]
MIGNDIVDLKKAAKDSPDSYRDGKRYQRFLDKIFTEKEQELIFYTEDKPQMLWLLWSMKEAAYKVHVQQFGKRFFNPKRLECELLTDNKGQVTIAGNLYFTKSIITDAFIHSVATLDAASNFDSKWFQIENSDYKTQSQTVKQFFLKCLSKTKRLDMQTLNIQKTEVGVPKVYNKSEKLPIAFSLSHCGNYTAFSILKNNSEFVSNGLLC